VVGSAVRSVIVVGVIEDADGVRGGVDEPVAKLNGVSRIKHRESRVDDAVIGEGFVGVDQ
jgi:hypothetical protein